MPTHARVRAHTLTRYFFCSAPAERLSVVNASMAPNTTTAATACGGMRIVFDTASSSSVVRASCTSSTAGCDAPSTTRSSGLAAVSASHSST